MSNGTDDLGDRMKMYERVESDRRFMPLLPIVARIDGRGFSKFTRGMERPYDKRLSDAMVATTKRLVEETHALMGYTQSDEITLLWNQDDLRSQIWFDGRVLKMNTALAASATLFFYQEILKTMPEYASRNPRFDARANNVPTKMEASNNFLWRERDASKNSVSMAARHYFSHNQVDKKNSGEMKDMLMSKGVNWNDYPAFFKRGTFVQRKVLDCAFSAEELAELPPLHKARLDPSLVFKRSRIVTVDMPVFDKVANRVDVLFAGADPIVKREPTGKVHTHKIAFNWDLYDQASVDRAIAQFNNRLGGMAPGEFGQPRLDPADPVVGLTSDDFKRWLYVDEQRVSHFIRNFQKLADGAVFEVISAGPFGGQMEALMEENVVQFKMRTATFPPGEGKPSMLGIVALDAVPA